MRTFPSTAVLEKCRDQTPDFMFPNDLPWIVFQEEALSPDICKDITVVSEAEQGFRFPHCKAFTRECRQPLNGVYKPICDFLLEANDRYWQYDLGNTPAAWMQTYNDTDRYDVHMDGSPGQNRKLTAVALLSKPDYYVGGELVIHIPPHDFVVPRIQGTIAVFPSWVLHEVQKVIVGTRKTINLGYWGPVFT